MPEDNVKIKRDAVEVIFKVEVDSFTVDVEIWYNPKTKKLIKAVVDGKTLLNYEVVALQKVLDVVTKEEEVEVEG